MVMRRKITEILKKWKESDANECALLIDGARRVGKSFIVEEFAKAEYPAYLMINFKYVGNDVKETFNEYLGKLDVFFERLFLVLERKPLPRGSLIVFDEVQAFPRAREAIKPLVADGRYHYVETDPDGGDQGGVCQKGIPRGAPSTSHGCLPHVHARGRNAAVREEVC